MLPSWTTPTKLLPTADTMVKAMQNLRVPNLLARRFPAYFEGKTIEKTAIKNAKSQPVKCEVWEIAQLVIAMEVLPKCRGAGKIETLTKNRCSPTIVRLRTMLHETHPLAIIAKEDPLLRP